MNKKSKKKLQKQFIEALREYKRKRHNSLQMPNRSVILKLDFK